MAQNSADVAKFLGIGSDSSILSITRNDQSILDHVDSYGAYELAILLADSMHPGIRECLKGLIVERWAAECLERVNAPTTLHPNELRLLFTQSPAGSLARLRTVELLREKDRLD